MKIPLQFLSRSRRREFFSMDWKLDSGSVLEAEASVNLSAKLYGIKL